MESEELESEDDLSQKTEILISHLNHTMISNRVGEKSLFFGNLCYFLILNWFLIGVKDLSAALKNHIWLRNNSTK